MKYFETRVDEETKGYVLTRIQADNETSDPGELIVRVNIDPNSTEEDATSVVFDKCTTALGGPAFDDLNVRVRTARMWLMRAHGNVEVLRSLMRTI